MNNFTVTSSSLSSGRMFNCITVDTECHWPSCGIYGDEPREIKDETKADSKQEIVQKLS